MARTHGSTTTNKLQRRQHLLPYYLRGATDAQELSKLLHCSIRTIQLDLKALRPWLHKKVEAEQLHSLRISFLQKWEIWREAWATYHRLLQNGKGPTDTSRAIRFLELAMKISAEFDRIAGIGQQKPTAIVSRQDAHTMPFTEQDFAKLSEDEQLTYAKLIRKLEQSKASSRT